MKEKANPIELYGEIYAKAVKLANHYPGKHTPGWEEAVDKHIKYMILLIDAGREPEGPEV